MFIIIRKVVFLCLICSSAMAASVDDVVFMTEQYPPYNLEKDDEVTGIAVDILTLMLKRTGSALTRDDIQLLPWARGYKRVLSEPNTCLFSTTRTEEREDLFKWVGPIAPNKVGLIGKKESNMEISSTEDIAKYKIGTIIDDVAELHLVNAGIELDSLARVTSTVQNIKKLNLGRIDLWGYGENVAMWELKANGLNSADYEMVYVLDASKELFFALNKDTPDSVIQELQSALDSIKQDGEYQKILDHYLQ
jgi:polar amino acid transport system substrate-binding protein